MKRARQAAGLTLEQLAERSGIASASIGELERNKRGGTIDTIECLADALHISIDEYVGHSVAPSREIKSLSIEYDEEKKQYVAKNGAELIGKANTFSQITNIIREYSSTK